MNREIQKRKKRFWAFCLALMFALVQAVPLEVLAASYTVSWMEETNTYSLGVDSVQPGDEIQYNYMAGSNNETEIVYLDSDGTTLSTVSVTNNNANMSHTVKSYSEVNGTKLDADSFKEWKAVEIEGSSGYPYKLTFQAVAYKQSNIAYVLNGGTNAVANPATYYEGKAVISLEEASKANYSFDGWYTDPDFGTGTGPYTSIQTDWTGDKTLYAKFTADTYTITYHNVDGATNTNPATYAYDEGVASLADASKTGYTFGGWYSDAEFTTAVTSIPATQTGAVDLYAKFTPKTYDIEYELNGGINGVGNPVEYTYGTGVESFADASKIGYTFGGWYSDVAFTTPVTSISATTTDVVKLYAKFTVNEYTITYHLDGGTNGAGNPGSYIYGTGVNGLSDASKTGHTFEGWYSDAAYTDANRVTSISATQVGDIDLYAKFTADTYNITYDLDGGTNAAGNPSTYTYGIGVAQFLDAIKTGYTFGGWFDEGFTTQITSITTGQVGAVSLYAKFTADTYTITYHNVDGATNTNPAAYTYDIGVTSFADASKTGYTFGGWYSDAALTTAVTSISATQTGAVDLYAKFTPITYNITYDLDGGTNAVGNPATYTCGTGVPSLADASKSGYTFGGWYSDAALTTKVTSISATQTGNVKLYAKFTFKKLKGEGSISVADVYYGKTPEAVATSSTNGTSAVTLQYKQKNASDATYTSTRPTKVGEYTARATFAETEVYEKLVVTDDFAIHYLNAPESPYNLDGTKGENGYYKSSVTIYPASGYLIADSLDGNYKEKLEITKSTNSFSTYLKKISTGEKTAGIAVPEIKIDTATPNIKNASSGDTLYGDEAEIIIEDDNLRQVFVNGEPVEFENGKAVLKLSSNQGEENYEIIGVDDAGNKKTIHVVVAADWMKTRQIPAGVKVKLFSKYSYTLGSGTWTVSGDGTTYSGNISFYVNSDGEYSFSN